MAPNYYDKNNNFVEFCQITHMSSVEADWKVSYDRCYNSPVGAYAQHSTVRIHQIPVLLLPPVSRKSSRKMRGACR